MRYHKSSTTESILRRGPSTVARMVASEFWRASEGAQFCDEATRALWRARELMGVLETANLSELIGQELLPYYHACSLRRMFGENTTTPAKIQEFASQLGEAFDRIADRINITP